jgi:hypothetical protein
MEWSFYYEGPREPETNFKCVTCLAGKTGECPTHGKNFDQDGAENCAHCLAAKGGPCHAHWGLAAALEHHPIDASSRDDWEKAISFVEAELAKMPPSSEKKTVKMKLRGDALTDGPAEHREFHVEFSVR